MPGIAGRLKNEFEGSIEQLRAKYGKKQHEKDEDKVTKEGSTRTAGYT